MTNLFRLFVTDTSPLITLAMADALDLLLKPEIPISIPDAVYVEATRIRAADGATAILELLHENRALAAIAPTEIGIDQLRRLEEGRTIRGLGEAAAIESLDRFLASDESARALLLFEETDILRRRAVVDARVTLVSTGDFLRSLEAERLIQSSDEILDRAMASGRNVDRQRGADSPPEARAAVEEHLRVVRDRKT